MKKIRINLMMVAAIVGVMGAVVTKVQTVKASGDTAYYWFDETSGDYQDLRIHSAEVSATGCNSTGPLCARGYNQDQLNDPNDPTEGVKENQINNQQDVVRSQN